MAYFKLELLTPNIVFGTNKNYGNITYFKDTISEFDLSNTTFKSTSSSNELWATTNFTYTYNEKLSIHQNSQKDLTFSLNLKTFSHNNWINNPFADLLHVGSKLLLTDKYNNTYIFNVTKIEYKPNEINTELAFTCQDTFSYQLARQNSGYTIKNDETSEDFIGARTLDYWALKIAQECHISFADYLRLDQGLCRLTLADGTIEYHVTNSFDNVMPYGAAEVVDFIIVKPIFPKPTELDKTYADYYEEIPFAVSGSTASAALIALGNELSFNLTTCDTFDAESKQQKSYFWFAPAHNDQVSGLTYSPYKNIQSFSFGNSGEALTTVLNVEARKLSDDSLVTMLPEVNGFFTQYFLDTEWEQSVFITGMFSKICQGNTKVATTDASFENAYLIATTYEAVAPEAFRNLWYQRKFSKVTLNGTSYICIPCYQNSYSALFHTPKWYGRINFRTHNQEVTNVLESAASHISFNTFGVYFDINTAFLGLFSEDEIPELLYLVGEDDQELAVEARNQDYLAAILIPVGQFYQGGEDSIDEADLSDITNYHIYFNWNRIPTESELQFAAIADQAPWLENKIIDFSYFVKQHIINQDEYRHLIDMIYNELRIVNGQLLVYYKSYVAAVQAKTKIVAEVLNSLDALGAALQADVIDVYATKGKLEDFSYFNQAYNTVLETQKQNKTLFNLPSLLEEYFRKYFNAEQRFLKNIHRFQEYFNAPISFGKEGTAIYQHDVRLSNSALPAGTTRYAFLTFPNAQFRTLPQDFAEWINDKKSINYGQPYNTIYYKNMASPVKIVTQDTLANYYLPLIRQDQDLLSCAGQKYSATQSYYYKENNEWKQADFSYLAEHYLNTNNRTKFYIRDQEYKSVNSTEPYLNWGTVETLTSWLYNAGSTNDILRVLCALTYSDAELTFTDNNLAQTLFDAFKKVKIFKDTDASYVYASCFPLANVYVKDYKYNIINGSNLSISVLNQQGLTYQQWYDAQVQKYPGEEPVAADFTNSWTYYPVSLVTPNNYTAFYHRTSRLDTQVVRQKSFDKPRWQIEQELRCYPSVEHWGHMPEAIKNNWATEGNEWIDDFFSDKNTSSGWSTEAVWNDCHTLNHGKSADAYDLYQSYVSYFQSHQNDSGLLIGEDIYQNNVHNWSTFYNLTGWTYNTIRSDTYTNVFYYQPRFWRILHSPTDIINNTDDYYYLPIYMLETTNPQPFDSVKNNTSSSAGAVCALYNEYQNFYDWVLSNSHQLYSGVTDYIINQDTYYFLRPLLQPLPNIPTAPMVPMSEVPDVDRTLTNSTFSSVHYHMETNVVDGMILRIAYYDGSKYFVTYGYIVHDEKYLRKAVPADYTLSMGVPYQCADDLSPAWGKLSDFVDDFYTPAQLDDNFINAQAYLINNNISDFLDDNYSNLHFYYKDNDEYLRAYTIKQVINQSDFFYLSNNIHQEINFTQKPSEFTTAAILNIVQGDDTTNSTLEKIELSDPIVFNYDGTDIDINLNVELQKYINADLPLITSYAVTTTQIGMIDSSITNGTFWYKYHDKLDWSQIWEYSAIIESELETYWQVAYAASKNCEYFLPEHWQQSINGVVNYFNNAIIQTDGTNVTLSSEYLPTVEVVSHNGQTNLPNYVLSRTENLKFKWTTNQESVDTSAFHLPSAVFGSNQAIQNVMKELGLATLDDYWTAESSGSTVYYYSNHGGIKWRDLIPHINMVNTSGYDGLGGLYQMMFKYFNENFINQDMETYNRLVERQSSVWKRIYNLYPGIVLESTYQNDSATTSADLYKMATYYFKDLSAPEKSYNIALINADQLEGYSGNELHIGDSIKLNIFDYYQNTELSIYNALDQYLFITDMNYSLRTDHDLSLTVNNIKYQDKMIQRLAKLIQ